MRARKIARTGDRPRVLLLSDATRFGGAEEYLAMLAEGLPAEGIDSEVLLAAPSLTPAFRERLQRTGRPFRHLAVASCQSRSPLRQPSLVPAYFKLVGALRAAEVDLLHFNLPGPYDALISWAAVAARRAGIPGVVTTEHLPCVPRYRKLSWLKVRAHRCVDRVLTVSRDNREQLVQRHRVNPDRVRVIHNGIDPGPFLATPPPSGDRLVIGCVGRLVPQKGQARLLDALASCRERIELRLIGEGPMQSELEDQVRRLGLEDRVELRGFRADLVGELAAIDLLVMPSDHEGLPLALLEAMAAGRGAVAFDVGGIREVIVPGRTGRLIPAGDVAGLAAALDDIARHPNLALEYGLEARRRVTSSFTRQVMVSRTAEVYRQVLAERSGGVLAGAEATQP